MFKRIKTKLKSCAGLTLTEMLVTVLVLMFFSTACLLGITTALKARQAAIKASDADILSSTIMQYISNEMRLSINGTVKGGGELFEYDGGSTYAYRTAGLSHLRLGVDDGTKGRLMRKIGDNPEFKVFNDTAYSGLKLDKLTFEDLGGNRLKCYFTILDDEGNEVKKPSETEFTVTLLNPPDPTSP